MNLSNCFWTHPDFKPPQHCSNESCNLIMQIMKNYFPSFVQKLLFDHFTGYPLALILCRIANNYSFFTFSQAFVILYTLFLFLLSHSFSKLKNSFLFKASSCRSCSFPMTQDDYGLTQEHDVFSLCSLLIIIPNSIRMFLQLPLFKLKNVI